MRKLYAVAIMIAMLFLCSGCNKEKEEEMLALREEGIVYMEQGEYEQAVTCFETALGVSKGKINDTEMDICFYKALAEYKLGDTDAAMETYNAVIEYNEHPKAYFLRGNLYYELDDEENALADYRLAADKEKEDYSLFIAIYETLVAKEKTNVGQEYLNRALEIKGDKPYDKMQKGRINFLLGETETAVSLLTEAAEEEPESYYYLFLIYDELEDSTKSIENLNTYLENEEELDSYKLYDMGTSLMNKEDYDNAIVCYTKALELEQIPNQQNIMKSLVIAYEKILDFTSAKEVMKEYVALYPEDEEAYREYIFLETR